MHGLTARAHLNDGDLEAALAALGQVHDVNSRKAVLYGVYVDPTTLELWLDIARIHVARHRFEQGFKAYLSLAYSMGGLIADRNYGNTSRLRMYWLERMVFVVHEMTSVWLNITDEDVRLATEEHVAHALLQIKVNLFLAVEKSKNVKNPDITSRIFKANRRYAAAARMLTAMPDSEDALLSLEAALFEREQLERIDLPYAENQLLPPQQIPQLLMGLPQDSSPLRDQFSPSAAVAATMVGDIRQLIGSDRMFVDYSLIDLRPPQQGRQGSLQGRRYVGIAVTERTLRIRDLGDAGEIDGKCTEFARACSAPGGSFSQSGQGKPASRHVVAEDPRPDTSEVEIDLLSVELYDRLVAPFAPLAPTLTLSPDGLLTGAALHALVRDDRWLAEDIHITYCHSLQLVANLLQASIHARDASSATSAESRRCLWVIPITKEARSNLYPAQKSRLQKWQIS